jgi:hypothetical protein
MRSATCPAAVLTALAVLVAGTPAVPAHAQAGRVAAGPRFGTLGIGGEAAVSLSRHLAFRTGFNYFSLSRDEGIDGITYALRPRLQTVPLLLDLHPTAGPFRLSAGVIINGNRAAGDGEIGQSVFIGDNEYTSAEVRSLTGAVDFRGAAPYAGLGFNSVFTGDGRVAFGLELGVMFHGHPRARLALATPLTGAAGAQLEADRRLEEQQIQSEIDDLPGVIDFYPVLEFGLSFRLR